MNVIKLSRLVVIWSISVLECSVTRVGLVTSCLNCKTRWRFVNFLTSPFFFVGNKSRFTSPSMISSLPVSLANTNVRSRASREKNQSLMEFDKQMLSG